MHTQTKIGWRLFNTSWSVTKRRGAKREDRKEKERTRRKRVNWCVEPSKPLGIISGLKETFIERHIVERTNKAELSPQEQSEKTESHKDGVRGHTCWEQHTLFWELPSPPWTHSLVSSTASSLDCKLTFKAVTEFCEAVTSGQCSHDRTACVPQVMGLTVKCMNEEPLCSITLWKQLVSQNELRVITDLSATNEGLSKIQRTAVTCNPKSRPPAYVIH